MKRTELIRRGFTTEELQQLAIGAIKKARAGGLKKTGLRRAISAVGAHPEKYINSEFFCSVAAALVASRAAGELFEPRSRPAPYRRWGDEVEVSAIKQMDNACALPVAARGALMPDAHLGYGLPIGGVLATHNAVIPYAVGVDIACRMKLTVLDLPVGAIDGQRDRLRKALVRETRFGIGSHFRTPHDHRVLDEDWTSSAVVKKVRDRAWRQLGTSGSGNHFVEYGELTIEVDSDSSQAERELGLSAGRYLALLSHSGSRGAGATIAGHFSRLAMDLHPELPKQLKHLAWLSLDSEAGQEYWHAMELMGRYAAANHELIHRQVAKALGASVMLDVENHHNFAWKEDHAGESLIVHRKGATPADIGVFGIIPGSMASPAYIVRGRGEPSSLNSASHGAGRVMSRRQAKQSFTWSETKKLLAERSVELISAGLDEVPMAYRDIDRVMAAQSDLVEPLARFLPRIVKMAPA